MRTFFICFFLLLIAFIGYAYTKNPAVCWEVVRNIGSLVTSVSPVHPNGTPVQPESTANHDAPSAAPAPTTSPSPSPIPSTIVISPPPAPPSALKKWAPPDIIPAQPNWTWNVANGKTYDNVVITTVKPDSVAITHSLGAATIPIILLPPDIQQKLNYDPEAAAEAKAEAEREEAHPYYAFTQKEEALKAARQLQWPVAWMCSHTESLNEVNPAPGSEGDLTQQALTHLKSQAVVIFIDSNEELGTLPPVILDQQFFQFDDGPVPGGHHFFSPKIVFSDANLTKSFGRVSHTQLAKTGPSVIDVLISSIVNDPDAQNILNGESTPTPAPATPAAAPQ